MTFLTGIAHWYRKAPLLVLLVLLTLSCPCLAQTEAAQDNPGPMRLTIEDRTWVEQTLKGLTLEEKVGQMPQVRYYADVAQCPVGRMRRACTLMSEVSG